MKKLVATALLVLGTVTYGWATPITFTATNGSNLSASATFDTSGSNLIVSLTNTSSSDVLIPADVLTALFFTLAGDPTLTPVSAVLNTGSTVWFGGTDPGNVVGGEWAYVNHLSGAPGSANEGISSSGLGGVFGSPNFPGSNLQNPAALDGLQYGITSAGDDKTTGNTPVKGGNALIRNSVIFTLSGLPSGYDLTNAVTNLSFQYGTALTEPNVPYVPPTRPPQEVPVPEPATVVLLGGGLLGIALYGRRRLSR